HHLAAAAHAFDLGSGAGRNDVAVIEGVAIGRAGPDRHRARGLPGRNADGQNADADKHAGQGPQRARHASPSPVRRREPTSEWLPGNEEDGRMASSEWKSGGGRRPSLLTIRYSLFALSSISAFTARSASGVSTSIRAPRPVTATSTTASG